MPRSRREFLASHRRRTRRRRRRGKRLRRAAAARARRPLPPPARRRPSEPRRPSDRPMGSSTIAEAQKLVRIELHGAGEGPDRRQLAARRWRRRWSGGPGRARSRSRRRSSPATRWNPLIPGVCAGTGPRPLRSLAPPGSRPASRARRGHRLRARSPAQSRWIESRALTSERLTKIYLERMERFDPKLHCVITPTPQLALEQARRADAEIAAGKYRGPLHGIPFGVKDLLDTKGILTTYGAEPYRNRVPEADAVVVDRLQKAGAVLVGEAVARRARLERHLVRRPDDEPVASRGGLRRLQRGPGRRDRRGARRVLDRQRDRRQHHRPGHALRRDGPAADVRPRRPHRRDDALLVARQARPHDPRRRGHPARPRRPSRARTPATSRACRATSTSTRTAPVKGLKRRIRPGVDEREPGDGGRPRRARNRPEARHDARRGLAARLAVRLAQHDPLRRGGRGLRGADAFRRPRTS